MRQLKLLLILSSLCGTGCKFGYASLGDKGTDTAEPDEVYDWDEDGDGYTYYRGDCNDTDPTIYPGAVEVCNEVDDNCDGEIDEGVIVTYAFDYDGDGYGDPEYILEACEPLEGYVDNTLDCNDTDAAVNPDAEEICDNIDQNCDGVADEGLSQTWYADTDSDGFGDEDNGMEACTQPTGYVSQRTDCNDADPGINPNAVEVCDEIDNDCDEMVDDADGNLDQSTTSAWFQDADGDGYGNLTVIVQACASPSGYVGNDNDCNDADPLINPLAREDCGDLTDNDCDGTTDQPDTLFLDADEDGYGDPALTIVTCEDEPGYVTNDLDCDDTDSSISPDADEICDSVDNDCDSATDESDAIDKASWYRDNDSDGYGDSSYTQEACTQPSGYVTDATDCDDTRSSVNPGAEEYCSTSYDDDCDGATNESSATDASEWYADSDSDGYGDPAVSATSCTAPAGYVNVTGDCDDTDATVYGGGIEVCDSVDNDCDGATDEEVTSTFYLDADMDGYGDPTSAAEACSAPYGYVTDATDCDDTTSRVNPAATETCNLTDDDCDSAVDESVTTIYYADTDSDGFGNAGDSLEDCWTPTGYVADDTDCDDTDAAVNPDGFEITFDPTSSGSEVDNCSDGDDNDCNGLTDAADGACQDQDGDIIKDGVDMLFACNLDGDSMGYNETLCIWASYAWDEPWNGVDCIPQEHSTWTSLNLSDAVTIETVTWAGKAIEVCPIDMTGVTPEIYTYRAVSYYGTDGTSTVDTSDCSDWVVSDFTVYGLDYSDPFSAYSTGSDGCARVGYVVDFEWTGDEVVPD